MDTTNTFKSPQAVSSAAPRLPAAANPVNGKEGDKEVEDSSFDAQPTEPTSVVAVSAEHYEPDPDIIFSDLKALTPVVRSKYASNIYLANYGFIKNFTK